ncbi:amino acid adenylation domain-containing protein [Sorangium sp. So ce375]|uniref:amino acid adenylation domain-containing protein n=1 Tax=Sorangium sp. So ce375 TaxID=3133306 RepID=UPI003F5CBC60
MTNKKKDVESIHYLSPLQQGLLFHAVSDRSADPYFVQTAFLLEGRLDLDAFERAWQALAERHPILRTAFVWEGVSRPVQVVRPRVTIPVARHDLRGLSAGEREEALAALMDADRRAGFDLLRAPLMRLTVVQAEEDAFYFINSHHHLLLDGWSFALLLREALLVYRALARGTVPELPRARPYRDYLTWVQAQDEGAAERFFRGALAGFRAPTPLPMEAGPAAAAAGGDAFPCAEQALRFSRAETEALAACARRLRITLNTLVQGAWALLLSRHSGEPDVVFGATVSGRPPELPGAEAIVGMLINTLPVRVRVDEHEPLAAWLSRLQDQNSELRQHEWTPLSNVQRWSDVPGGRALFDTLVVFDSYPEEEVPDVAGAGNARDVRVHPLPRPGGGRVGDALLTTGRNNYPASLIVEPSRELGLILSYERRRLTHEAAASLLGQCRALLEAMAARPRARLAELPLVGPAERRRLLTDLNATATASPPAACVHELFEAHAAAQPGALAVVCEETALTYGELDRKANQLARRLRALGVGPESRVVLCIERSAEMVLALLGVLKAGAAYVPVDPKFPRERLRAVVEDGGARVVVTQERWAGAFDGPGPALLFLDRDAGALAAEPDAPLDRTARPENIAYLIYTSGSTGRPKGVAVEHRHLVSYVRGVLARLPLAEGGGMALVSTVAADLGHTSLFGALCSGRTLHVLSEAQIFDPDATAEHMSRHGVDALKIVPSHLAALLEAAQPARVLPRRCLVLGGEASSWELIERIRSLAPGCAVVNHYGPTETTVGSLTWQVDPADGRAGATVPIGRPLPNTQAYVLGVNIEPVPVGVPGELYLGGAGVTRGYHARPELTAERFVPDPFGGVPGGRLYRTGDRARLRADGAIEFLGRTDHQIKLRGHRVELGEIEALLREQPEVQQAVVVARDHGGTKRLVGYVVGREAAAVDAAALLARLAQRLPDYMVPSAIVPLPALPLTANGKIDRAALPEPDAARAPRGDEHVAPRNDVEATLARIWAEVLRRGPVGVHDDFFAMGGDSIMSLQIIARANREGLRLSPKQIFERRTIAALASDLAGAPAAPEPPAPPAPPAIEPFQLARLERAQLDALLQAEDGIEDVLPASPVQQGMLFHSLLTPEASPYFNQIVCTFARGLDVEAFARTFEVLSARHAILRTGFLTAVAEPHQIVRRAARLPLEVLDWRELSSAEQAAALDRYLRDDRHRGFRFEEPPLMRVAVMRLPGHVDKVVWSVHHALLDGWCQGLVLKEWLTLYEEARRGALGEREAAPPYRSYIAWLERQDMAAAEAFFRAHLKGLTAPTRLPELAEAPQPQGHAGFREHRALLSPDATSALQGFARAQGVTLNTVVQAAWALLLARYSGEPDVLFGITVAGRPADLPEAGSIMGAFINSLPLRLRVPPASRLADWLQQIQALNLELRQYEYSPLVQVQRWSEVERGTPLFDSLLVFQNYPVDQAVDEHRRALGIEVSTAEAWTNYPLTVYVVPGNELALTLSFDAQRLDEGTVARMAAAMCALLERMAGQPEARLGGLAPLGDPQMDRLAAERRSTRRDYRSHPCLPEMLAAQAARTPDAVAVTCGRERLTYGELNARANRLAHALRRRGVGSETLVGLCVERSLEMMVGLLGILKSGGAYVPLDPAYPRERLRAMLEDSRLPLLLTQESLLHALPDTGARALCLDRDWPSIAGEPDWAPAPLFSEESLAYVIYTSGSTGRPKGVMVRHGGVTNFLLSMQEHLSPPRDVAVLATTSISFDIAVLELFLPLLTGGRVELARREDAADGERLTALLRASGATLVQATPTGWKVLLENGRPRLAGLTVLCGGEAFPRELARRFLEAGVAPWNLYGPTETTVWSSIHRVTAGDGPIPLGTPIANTELHVLDRQLYPAPLGVAGELCIGGAGLARGYLDHPDLTADRFIPDPFSEEPGRRLYRTGDLARFRRDGTLEFLGRRDHQIKIRGFRIELGEIEAQLRTCPDVRDAVVVAREDAGTPRLAAYVIPERSAALTADGLRAWLKERLPDYMVPAAYVWLDELPLTPNGKVNRKALPAPGLVAREQRARPRTATEEIVAAIWAEVLGLEAVGVHESFFELGGHSLLATRAISRIRGSFQVELPLRSMFDHPTVARLAGAVDDAAKRQRGAALPPITRQPRDGELPLSFAQQRLWFLAQLEPDSAGYNMTAAVRVEGALDVALLRESLAALVQRHESLRTTFGVASGEPVQVIAAEAAPAFEVVDLSTAPAAERGAQVQRLAAERAERPFDLARGPLLRVTAIKLRDDELVLVVVVHHIVADGWTMNVLVAELAELYAAARAARPPALKPLPVQYADFAVWQRRWMQGATREALLGAWRERLSGHPPPLDLRPDHPRPAAPSYRGARHTIAVDRALSEALRALGRREGATLFMTLLAAFKVVLLGRTGQSDLLVGTDVAGRNRAEIEGLIGFFVNLLVLRTDLGGLPTFRELLQRVREVTLDAYAHQDLPFEQVVDALRPAREPGRHPLVQTLFVLQNVPASEISLPGVRFSAVELDREVSRFDLGVFVEETDEGLTCAWKYRADLFEPPTIEAMAAHFMAVLRAIVDDPDRRVTALAAAERKERIMEGRARDEGRLRSLKRITPRKVDVGPSALVATSTLGDGPLPLVVKPAVADVELAAWAREERAFVEAQLLRHGALLFRGFPIRSAPEFEQVAQAICGELFGEYGDLPREKTGQHIYSSTPYPADKAILFHNESSHLPRWPLKQWFFCVQAAPEGGATPIVDCRRLHEALAPDVRERFRRSGLLYVRNFTPGFDVSWQDFFHTTDRAVVEERCRAGGMRCEWLAGDRLRISQRGPAVLSHPKTGEQVFFNQIQLHHPAYLEAPVRESLLAMVGEQWLPRNVTYGDGAPIEVETTRALGEAYERCAVRFPWQEGDIILLDNMLVAHGRDPFSGPRKIVVAMGEMMTAERAARASDGAVAS